jgi:DNA-binding beta-propeller fold protein YncE
MGRKNYKILIFLCLCVSCVKDKPAGTANIRPTGSRNVYVVCEGNYGNGNASLYAWNPSVESVYGDIYKSANNMPLGDVFQSMIRFSNNFFLIVNNSDKIIVIDAVTYKLVSTISIHQPREMLITGSDKAYVSTLWSNKVYVINTLTYTITDSVTLPSLNPEAMCLSNNTAVITSWDTANRNIYLVDINTDKIIQTIQVAGFAPHDVLIDKDGLLWVLSGDQPDGKTAAFTKIDPSTGAVLDSFIFPAAADPVKPVLNPAKDTIWFIETPYDGSVSYNGIYRMGVYDKQLPQYPFLAGAADQYYYALGIDPATGNIYISDPKGFTQKGTVYIYKPGGALVNKFNVGLGPGSFFFD